MPIPTFQSMTAALTPKSLSSGSSAATVPTPKVYEFLPGRLYLTALNGNPVKSDNVHYFTVDQELAYVRFYSDFGPNNLAHVFRFIAMIGSKLSNSLYANKKIVLYSSMANDKRANAAYLMCNYMMLMHNLTPEQAFAPVEELATQIPPYRDAGYGAATYFINILDCLRGLHRAIRKGICKLEDFNVADYEYYEQVEHGDMNWVLPGKFLAFATPHDETSPDFGTHITPYRAPRTRIEDTIAYFKKTGVTLVVRLNNKTYDRQKFLDAGINHIDMYFPDGSCPPDSILHAFIDLAERTPGKIAVHCKAGLGRTGSLIAAYIMKHYHFTASEVISWLRIIRPGSVVGPQQNYLQAIQSSMWKLNLTRQRSGELNIDGGLKGVKQPRVEAVFVEPTDVVATTTMVDNKEFVVPVQPRKGEISAAGAYIVASSALSTDEQAEAAHLPRSLRSNSASNKALKASAMQNVPVSSMARPITASAK